MSKAICSFNKRFLFPLEKQHLSRIKDWRNSQMDILRQNRLLTDCDQEEWFRRISCDTGQVIFSIKEICNRRRMRFIGYCGITNMDSKKQTGEISFLVNPVRVKDKRLYKQDFLSVLYMLCGYGFERLELNKIYAETYVFRDYHIKILEEFGLRPKEVLKERKFVNGRRWDSIIHSMLQNEWLDIKERVKSVLEK